MLLFALEFIAVKSGQKSNFGPPSMLHETQALWQQIRYMLRIGVYAPSCTHTTLSLSNHTWISPWESNLDG